MEEWRFVKTFSCVPFRITWSSPLKERMIPWTWTGGVGDVLYGDVSLGVSIGKNVERHKIVVRLHGQIYWYFLYSTPKEKIYMEVHHIGSAFVWPGIGTSAIFIMLVLYIFQFIRRIPFAKLDGNMENPEDSFGPVLCFMFSFKPYFTSLAYFSFKFLRGPQR